jgi:hypothetical protein
VLTYPLQADAYEVVFYENVQLRSSVPSFIQLKRFEKTHFGSMNFGAENRPFSTRTIMLLLSQDYPKKGFYIS